MTPLTKRSILLTTMALFVLVPPTAFAALFGVMGLKASIPLASSSISGWLTLPTVVFGWLEFIRGGVSTLYCCGRDPDSEARPS